MKVEADPEEILLLSQLSDGSLTAFNRIYTTYAPQLYKRLLRLLKDPEVVEEVLQDVFLKVWDKRDEIIPDRGFRTFIFRMSDNLAIDLFRKIGRDKKLQMELWAASISFYFHLEENVLKDEEITILKEAIETLSPKRKQILILCKLEEKSYKETAEILGVSVSTVSNQLVKAMKDIKGYIEMNYKSEFVTGLLVTFFIKF
ncbi:RNA polymerase sigma factor [Albibacterium indicum]|uniref:RNA polymerase sigma factor n=1 Tax=Albibacterium indicum TaxID=2292082 RepID=UPI000E555855|nr:sigma-70 family RNA polymerase sigma factor [Pedobacter indicus]